MNEHDRELLEDLKALGSLGPREAPAHVEEHLKVQFRRQRHRRRLVTWAPIASVAAAAVFVLLLWIRSAAPGSVHSAIAATHAVAPVMEEEADASFYPLPQAEALPAMEVAMVVRVQMPVSSLQMIGFPVSTERVDASVQADLLLGQDGLARGVRLAQ